MNTHSTSKKSSRGQLADWWTEMQPLLRRVAPCWGVCLVLLTGLWLAGAHFSARYESLTPQVGLVRVPLKDYVKRGRDIPAADNAATLYMETDKLLGDKKHWKSDSEEALRLCRYLPDDLTVDKWQTLAAFAAETDSIAMQVREAGRRPLCVFSPSENIRGYCTWQTPDAVTACLVLRARVAGHQGNAPAWREAMEDLLGFLESTTRERTPVMVHLQHRVLGGMLQALEDACAAGAVGDNVCLAALDARLAALKPMDAFEPLLALAWSTMDFRHSMEYWGIYPRYFPESMLRGEAFYGDYLDIPYRAEGFSARDRVLCTAYISELLRITRTGLPNVWEQAWLRLAGPAGLAGEVGRVSAPHYDELCRATGANAWGGSPGTLYTNKACIRMARAMIVVLRQGRDEQGLFRSPDYLKGLLCDFPCPMTGQPITCRGNPHECNLAYRVSRGPWQRRDYWELLTRLDLPSVAHP